MMKNTMILLALSLFSTAFSAHANTIVFDGKRGAETFKLLEKNFAIDCEETRCEFEISSVSCMSIPGVNISCTGGVLEKDGSLRIVVDTGNRAMKLMTHFMENGIAPECGGTPGFQSCALQFQVIECKREPKFLSKKYRCQMTLAD